MHLRPLRAALLLPLLLAAAVRAKPAAPAATLVRHDGFMPWSWDANDSKILLEVVPGQQFLWGAGLAGGAGTVTASLDRGQLGDLALCVFERSGKSMMLRRLQTSQRAGDVDAERARVVEESFPSAILAAMPVISEGTERVTIDATAFLLTDPYVARMLEASDAGDWSQAASLSSFRLQRSGAFPLNTEIEVELTFTCEKPPEGFASVLPDGRSMTLQLHHTFMKLPEPGFETREVDPRVGYFSSDWTEHARPVSEPIARRLASRWRLVKKDPAARVSAPVEPIVFYLDRGIPEPERRAVHDAALWWNHAFEKAGFINAFVIRDLPEGATLLDARYSGIAWVSRAERAWSIGQSQVDPRTGEIVHAVVILDSHRRRTTARTWQDLSPVPANGCRAAGAPDLAAILADPVDAPGVSEEHMVLARLRYLAAHEVGHALGLAHDWAATTFGWGSVMDYLGPHVEPNGDGLDLSDVYPTDVGSYDLMAVAWGYTPGLDRAALDAIVSDGLARGIVFPLEGDARWAEYDWGPDAAAWLDRCLQVRRIMLEHRFGAGQLKPGEPYYSLQERFNLAYLYHRFAVQAAQQVVGGQHQANAVKGDGQVPWSWVPRARQEDALRALMAALAPESLAVPEHVSRELVPSMYGVPRSREQLASDAGNATSPLTAARILAKLIVEPLLAPDRAARLAMAPAGESLTLRDVLGRLQATWSEPAPGDPALVPLQRIAQRAVLDATMRLASSDSPAEVRAAAFASLTALQATMKAMHPADKEQRAHVDLALRDLGAFLADPAKLKLPSDPPPPPGRPI